MNRCTEVALIGRQTHTREFPQSRIHAEEWFVSQVALEEGMREDTGVRS